MAEVAEVAEGAEGAEGADVMPIPDIENEYRQHAITTNMTYD